MPNAYTKSTLYPAPDFKLAASDGTTKSLADFRGKWVVLYFYPKDETPGCTAEACSLRDARDQLAGMGAEVIGISRDSVASHEKFQAHHSLNFLLLSDPGAAVHRLYGAWGKKMFGLAGVLRQTFIIDPEGRVRQVYPRVTPTHHGEQVIADLKRLQG
jgi:peroxiredoxin Q/BCP